MLQGSDITQVTMLDTREREYAHSSSISMRQTLKTPSHIQRIPSSGRRCSVLVAQRQLSTDRGSEVQVCWRGHSRSTGHAHILQSRHERLRVEPTHARCVRLAWSATADGGKEKRAVEHSRAANGKGGRRASLQHTPTLRLQCRWLQLRLIHTHRQHCALRRNARVHVDHNNHNTYHKRPQISCFQRDTYVCDRSLLLCAA